LNCTEGELLSPDHCEITQQFDCHTHHASIRFFRSDIACCSGCLEQHWAWKMAYLASIHRPSSVRHALKLKFLHPEDETLVVA